MHCPTVRSRPDDASPDLTLSKNVEFGVHLPQWGELASRKDVLGVAEAAEHAGFHSVWVGDHIVWPVVRRTPYPFAAAPPVAPTAGFLEPFTQLALVAGATQRIKLGIGALVLPLRHPLVVAKAVATLDVLSEGRTLLAVGAGWLREEFDALGVSFEGRGDGLEAGIEVIRAAWKDGRVARCVPPEFEEMFCLPLPMQDGGPPLWVGGMSDAAMSRAGRLGDGWYAVGGRLDALSVGRERVRDHAMRAGRDPDSLTIAVVTSFERDPMLRVDRVAALVEAGADLIVFGFFGATSSDPMIEALNAYGNDVLPRFTSIRDQ